MQRHTVATGSGGGRKLSVDDSAVAGHKAEGSAQQEGDREIGRDLLWFAVV